MWWLITLGVIMIFIFSMMKSASDADDIAEKLLNKKENTYKNK